MKNLLLTLGHNSSAILIEDNNLVWGYETERITGVKSDSKFPRPVIDFKKALRNLDMVYVTHWTPNGRLDGSSPKHWDPSIFENIPIRSLDVSTTHHDTHMAAAMCYAGDRFPYDNRTYGLVIDGFGTYGEHLSIYRLTGPHAKKLVRRVHGYGTSLGLMFQYATAFMGMKMNEDEYKLLGYEVHVPPELVESLDEAAGNTAHEILAAMESHIYGSKLDPVFSLDALSNVKMQVFRLLTDVCTEYEVTDPTTFRARTVLSYYVQAVLEAVVMKLLSELPNYNNLILSGGVFYNVKLNQEILKTVEGQLCVYPLAGDQGNAIGLYYEDHPDFVFPNDLCWGHRDLDSRGIVRNMHIAEDWLDAAEMCQHFISKYGYVNLVRGSMEFGPRALCNTSTLAMPNLKVVGKINAANDRNTVMPMAPVMTERMYRELFERTSHVWKSHQHMIIAMEYYEHPMPDMLGIAHGYEFPYRHHTGRPQVVDSNDLLMHEVLNYYNHPLINTSFNYHGNPIAFDMESVILNHMMQINRDPTFHTVVLPK